MNTFNAGNPLSDMAKGRSNHLTKRDEMIEFIFGKNHKYFKKYDLKLDHGQIALRWVSSKEGLPLVCRLFGKIYKYPEITGIKTFGNISESIWQKLCEDYLIRGIYKFADMHYNTHFIITSIAYDRLQMKTVRSVFDNLTLQSRLVDFLYVLVQPRVYGLDYLTFLNVMENEKCTHYQMMIGLFYLKRYGIRSFSKDSLEWLDYADLVIQDKFMYEKMILFISKGYFSKDLVYAFCKRMIIYSKWHDFAYLIFEGLEDIPEIDVFPKSVFKFEIQNNNDLNYLIYLFEAYIWIAFDYQEEISRIAIQLEERGMDISRLKFVIGDIGMTVDNTK
jgi:hypothetical protein